MEIVNIYDASQLYKYISCYYLKNMEIVNIYDASQVKPAY